MAAFIDDICNGGSNHPKNLAALGKLLHTLGAVNFKIGAGKIEVGAE